MTQGFDTTAIHAGSDADPATGARQVPIYQTTAYAFRDSENPACTCQSNARGLPQIPISVDPTLRNGDIVVMPDGLKVFRGAGNVPHPDTDFTSVASSKALSGVVRQQVLSLEQRIATPQ